MGRGLLKVRLPLFEPLVPPLGIGALAMRSPALDGLRHLLQLTVGGISNRLADLACGDGASCVLRVWKNAPPNLR
jgi:hypothetical protein